ncbi:MAG: YifB family Mg chelatase-like AAA ATPase [Solirubrobacterales bacterium]
MLAVAHTFTLVGVGARPVGAEVDVHRGLPAFSLVGLPDAAVRESRERVRAAIVNSGFEFPLRRITASLAPADLRKAGPALDLAIAAALLAASEQLDGAFLETHRLAGELALDGSIRAVPGVIAMAEEGRKQGAEAIAVPGPNVAEAGLVGGLRVVGLNSLVDLRALSSGELPEASATNGAGPAGSPDGEETSKGPDLAELRGQPLLRRALEVAAAGGHNMLIVGPPGAGKSLGARRLPSILPALGREEAIEVTRIAGVCGSGPPPGTLARRPFRSPHHTISAVGLVGGGLPPRPGEITHAHLGVLFLDELGEFSRQALEALRQPLEDGGIRLTRGVHAVDLPSRFMLVAATNPCPCGHGESSPRCSCAPATIRRYHSRLSGPLADRIDVAIAIAQPSAEALAGDAGETSATVRERVEAARTRQLDRLEGRYNAQMSAAECRAAGLTDSAEAALAAGHARLALSGRGYERVLRLSRTIADLDSIEWVDAAHVGEALTFRWRFGRS